MKLMSLVFVFSVIAFASSKSFAVDHNGYFTISKVEIVEIAPNGEEKELALNQAQESQLQSGGDVGVVIAEIREIIALGKEIYQIVKAGEPVVNTQFAPISVLPKDERGEPVNTLEMENWSQPKTKKYGIRCKNTYGMTTIKFDFMMMFSYGGSYNGKGKYITAAQVVPTLVEAAWGYSLDATFKLDSIMNNGTKNDPVAGAVIRINYKIGTVLKKFEENRAFYINGLGTSQDYQ
jgi:hypothetical protein